MSARSNRGANFRRAQGVKDYLVSKGGFAESQVRAVSYGEQTERLVNRGKGPGTGGRENRRTVIVIDHPGAAPGTKTLTQ